MECSPGAKLPHEQEDVPLLRRGDDNRRRVDARSSASAPPLSYDEERGANGDRPRRSRYPMPPFPMPQRPPPPYEAMLNYDAMPPREQFQQERVRQSPYGPYEPTQGYAYRGVGAPPGYIPPQQPMYERYPPHDPPPYEDMWMRQVPDQSPMEMQQQRLTRDEWVALNQHGGGRHHGWGHAHGHGGGMRAPFPPCPPDRRGRPGRWRVSGRPTPNFLVATLRLCVFHSMNAFLGAAGCAVVSAGVCAAVMLLPACCVGLLVFRLLMYVVLALAQWDITLGNYIAPSHQLAYAHLPPYNGRVGDGGLSGYRLTPSLASFSPLSLMAMVYYLVVKPVTGCLSLLSVALVVAPGASLLAWLLPHHHHNRPLAAFGMKGEALSRYPGLSLVTIVCLTLLGVALMQLMAKISLQATRFFCCEKFTLTSRFAGPPPYHPHSQFQPLVRGDAASYGTARMQR